MSLKTLWRIDDMLIGFLSLFSLLFFFGSFQDFQNSYVMPLWLWPGHFPVWVCFIASLTSSADVSAFSSVISSLWSFSFTCFFILFIALLLAIFLCGFSWSCLW